MRWQDLAILAAVVILFLVFLWWVTGVSLDLTSEGFLVHP